MKKLPLLVVGLLSLLGCSTMLYKEPEAGPRARIRFATASEGVTVLRQYDDDECKTGEEEMMRLRNGFLVNSSPRRLGMPLWNFHENAAKEVYVRTDKRFHGLFKSSRPIDYKTSLLCGYPFSSDFIDGQDYEILYEIPDSCRVKIFKLESLPTGEPRRVPQPLIAKRPGACRESFDQPRMW